MLTQVERYLGPALVQRVSEDRIELEVKGEKVWAQLALAFPYQPVQGDRVLVAGEEEYYIIGVLLGRGKTSFQVPGELELKGDTVNIVGNERIQLQSPHIQIKADQLETYAQRIFDRCVRAYRWVKESFQIRAGRMQTNTKGHHLVQAERLIQHGKEDVRINGPKIRLG